MAKCEPKGCVLELDAEEASMLINLLCHTVSFELETAERVYLALADAGFSEDPELPDNLADALFEVE